MSLASHYAAWRVTEHAPAQLESIPLMLPKHGEVLIQIKYSSLNYKDALAITGKGKIARQFPLTLGIDLAGEVVESADSRFQNGEKVLVTGCNIGEVLSGGLAEYACLPADIIVPLPEGLSLEESMMIGTAGFTAALALKRMEDNAQNPTMGDILVSGATGGVGSIAVNLFSDQGYAVTALTGKTTDFAQEYLHKLGAKNIMPREGMDFGKRPLEKARWGGAVDNLGGDVLAYMTRTVQPWGNIAAIGLAANHELHTTVMPFILRGASLLGIHSVECPWAWRVALWQKLATTWKPSQLTMISPHRLALSEVADFCAQLMAGTVTGRAVVVMS